MFVSKFLIILFLLILIGECYFIGKYFQIKYEFFANQKYIIFPMGFLVYVFITAICMVFFSTLNLNNIYISIIFSIKDFFIIIILISKRNIFKKIKINYIYIFITIIFTITATIIFKYIIEKYLVNSNFLKPKTTIISWIEKSLLTMTFSKKPKYIHYFLIYPLSGIIIFNIFSSLFTLFFKYKNNISYSLIFIFCLIYLLLFNFQLEIKVFMTCNLLIFLILSGYNLIIYSRRRYAAIFGISSISIWSINQSLFLAICIITIAIFAIYTLQKKPKASFFTIQLISPLLIIVAFLLYKSHKIESIITIIITIGLYLSIFIFNRFSFIYKNLWLKRINFFWPIILLITLLLWGSISIFNNKSMFIDLLLKDKELFIIVRNKLLLEISNIFYYIIISLLSLYVFYIYIKKKRFIGFNLLMAIILLICIYGFNPILQICIFEIENYDYFYYMKVIVFTTLFIVLTSKFSSIIYKKIVQKNIKKI